MEQASCLYPTTTLNQITLAFGHATRTTLNLTTFNLQPNNLKPSTSQH
ncbi:MAG: hypothetical protein F6K37_32420 [Moorea sp. SIO4E2]|nr:hypothetical protein [Moorena sp. SIO4E2]